MDRGGGEEEEGEEEEEEEEEENRAASAWLARTHRSSCFILSRKAGPSPTTKRHLDIPAGNQNPTTLPPRAVLITLVHGSPSLPSTVALTLSPLWGQ